MSDSKKQDWLAYTKTEILVFSCLLLGLVLAIDTSRTVNEVTISLYLKNQ
jgi:hypothetical protein